MVLSENAKIFFYDKPVNMYKGFDSLLSIIITELKIDLIQNTYVLFVNGEKNRLKMLFFENGHISILAMRMSGAMKLDFGSFRELSQNEFYELITDLRTKKNQIRYGIKF
jgi:IS66 Orf2 like protein